MRLRRRHDDVVERHAQIVALSQQGMPAIAIARKLGYADHTSILHHLRGQCKCLPLRWPTSPEGRVLDALRIELREVAEHISRLDDDRIARQVAQALRRALLLAGVPTQKEG